MLKHNKGFTLIELLVTVVVGAIAVAIVLSILKRFYSFSDQMSRKIDSQTYVKSFVDNFYDEIESAGYIDYAKGMEVGQVIYPWDCPAGICVSTNNVKIQTNLVDTGSFRVRQQLEYVIKRIDPPRSTTHPDEMGIYKYKTVSGLASYANTDSNALVLAGVKSFTCSPFDPLGARFISCQLVVYRSLTLADTDTYRIYAINEN